MQTAVIHLQTKDLEGLEVIDACQVVIDVRFVGREATEHLVRHVHRCIVACEVFDLHRQRIPSELLCNRNTYGCALPKHASNASEVEALCCPLERTRSVL